MELHRVLILLMFGVATGIATLAGGGLALRLGERLHLVLGASAGAVLGVGLFGLAPEAIELGGGANVRGALVALSLGFAAYMVLERTLGTPGGSQPPAGPGAATSHLGPASLTVHSFLDGVGIGFAFQVSPVIGSAVGLAVLAHDACDGVNTVTLSSHPDAGPRRSTPYWLGVNALAPLVGIAMSSVVRIDPHTLGLVLGGFAGAFLYIGAVELLPRSYRRAPNLWTTGTTIAAMAAMYVVTSIAS